MQALGSPWTDEEDLKLHELWENGDSDDIIAEKFSYNRTIESVRKRCRDLGYIQWTQKEDETLLQLWLENFTDEEIAERHSKIFSSTRSAKAIESRRKRLGYWDGKKCTVEETEKVRELGFQGHTDEQISEHYKKHSSSKRTVKAIQRHRDRKPQKTTVWSRKPVEWNEEEDKILLRLYLHRHNSDTEIAKHLPGKSLHAVRHRRIFHTSGNHGGWSDLCTQIANEPQAAPSQHNGDTKKCGSATTNFTSFSG